MPRCVERHQFFFIGSGPRTGSRQKLDLDVRIRRLKSCYNFTFNFKVDACAPKKRIG